MTVDKERIRKAARDAARNDQPRATHQDYPEPPLGKKDGKPHAGSRGNCFEKRRGSRPLITVDVEEERVNDEAVAALASDATIFQRGGVLVRVIRDERPAGGIQRTAPRIDALLPAILRERLAASADWITVRETENGLIETPAHPPGWCVNAVHARGHWQGIRRLEGIVEFPVMRADGSILQNPGYDSATGLLLEPAGPMPMIAASPSRDDAIRAKDNLLSVVSDFPLPSDLYRAAWLAALLTPLARFAIAGPAPLFLVDANVRGSGKGLLLDTTALIATGERFTVATYTNDEDELRKRITALVLGGDRLVLFDNLEGKFGNATLDAALTGTKWRDRLLGVNRMVESPMYMTWFATGNNVILGADTSRRVCHVRLESAEERPETRSGFQHPNLRGFVQQNRGKLLGDALTILRAHASAGWPKQNLTPWGSFEGWSDIVREAVVWVDLPDPGETRIALQDQADTSASAMASLLAELELADPEGRGKTAAEIIELAKEGNRPELADAVTSLAGRLDSRALGNKLRSYRRRIFEGRFLDSAGTAHRAARWAVHPANQFSSGLEKTHHTHETHSAPRISHFQASPDNRPSESGESGESFSAQGKIEIDV